MLQTTFCGTYSVICNGYMLKINFPTLVAGNINYPHNLMACRSTFSLFLHDFICLWHCWRGFSPFFHNFISVFIFVLFTPLWSRLAGVSSDHPVSVDSMTNGSPGPAAQNNPESSTLHQCASLHSSMFDFLHTAREFKPNNFFCSQDSVSKVLFAQMHFSLTSVMSSWSF